MRHYSFDLESVELSATTLKEFDAVILATDHDQFDFDIISEHSKILLDTRGRYRNKRLDNIVRA